jgi:hypothetical protein
MRTIHKIPCGTVNAGTLRSILRIIGDTKEAKKF